MTDFVDFQIFKSYSLMVFAVTPPWDFLTPQWNFALNRKIPHSKNYAMEAGAEWCEWGTLCNGRLLMFEISYNLRMRGGGGAECGGSPWLRMGGGVIYNFSGTGDKFYWIWGQGYDISFSVYPISVSYNYEHMSLCYCFDNKLWMRERALDTM